MTSKLKIYTNISFAELDNFKHVNPLLGVHWDKLEPQVDLADQANFDSPFLLTSDPDKADYFVLPKLLTYYLKNNKRHWQDATSFAELSERYQKQMVVWHNGDLQPVVRFKKTIVFLPGIVESQMKDNLKPCPAFVKDPLETRGDGNIICREKKDKAVVGFCGYAAVNALKTVWGVGGSLKSKVIEGLGTGDYQSSPLIPATLLRAKAIKLLSASSQIVCRFVIRDKYRVGHAGNEALPPKSIIAQEFVNNIVDTDYTLCIRGYVNWSYRFYETLACGRIPVFVNTECKLPFDDSIDWKKY